MSNHKVSVIIPCFNNEKTIERCILSVLKQTHKNVEIVCVDDASSDASLDILYNLSKIYGNLSIYTNQKNSGVSFTRNKGVLLSSGDMISFLDADDFWHERKLELQLLSMAKLNLDVIGAICVVGEQAKKDIRVEDLKVKPISFNMMLFKNYMPIPSILMKREAFISFDERQRYSEDYKMLLDVIYNKKRCGLISGVNLVFLDKFFYGVSGLSSNLWLMEKNEIQNLWFFLGKGKLMALPAIALSLLKYAKRCIVTKTNNLKKGSS